MRWDRFALLALSLLALPGWSEVLPHSAEDAHDGVEPRVRATLLLDLDEARGRGSAGVLFDLDPGWHLYWRNPGDSGLAPDLRFEFSASHVQSGEVEWPAPREFREDEDLVTYGYEGQVLLAAPLHFGSIGRGARARVDADVLVCADQCLPARFRLERPFDATAPPEQRVAIRALFERYARRVPASASERGLEVSLVPADPGPTGAPRKLSLEVRGCAPAQPDCAAPILHPKRAAFFAYAPEDMAFRASAVRAAPGAGLRIALEGSAAAGPAEGDRVLRGVLVIEDDTGRMGFDVTLPLPAPDAALAQAPPLGVGLGALLRALALGFLGGLLLNLMPCVLPVLAIKVFAIAELAERGRRGALAQAGAYAAGILLSLMALGLGVALLRWSGTAVGWGFHLQQPVFVAAVAAVLVVFAMNLLGAFEIEVDTGRLSGLGAGTGGARRSFFDGLLAVVLATPCSAPFLGTALGFAFASPTPVILAIFASIGLGLASPFVAIALLPGGSRFVPRSGPWMLELRRALGFALILSALWLAWIVGRTGGVDAMAGLLALLVALAFAAWIFGLVQRGGRRAPTLLLLSGSAAIFLAGIDAIDLRPRESGEAAEGSRSGSARVFSPSALAESLDAGRPAFVYFTADWCMTCKLNERRVLSDPRAHQALASHGFDVFRADWTTRDDVIRTELARLGRAGVPVYALYAPADPATPRLLSEILSLDGFVSAVDEVAAQARAGAARPDAPIASE